KWLPALLACIAADVFVFRPLFIFATPPQGLTRGAFERLRGTPVIAENAKQDPVMIPDMAIDRAGRVLTPPGTVALLPLVPGVELEVEAARGESAPYVVLGARRSLPAGGQFDDDARPGSVRHVYVGDAVTLAAGEDGAALGAWDGGRPWSADAATLADLARRCAGTAATPPRIAVRVDGGTVTVRLGGCTATYTWPEADAHDLVMAVLSATTGAHVARNPGGFAATPLYVPKVAGIAGLLGGLRDLLVMAAFGPGAALLASGTVAAASVALPFEAALLTLISVPVVLVVSLVRRLLASRRGRFTGRVAAVATAAALLLVMVYSKGNLWGLGGGTVASEHVADDVTCLVLGYSMVAGEGMQPGSKGIFEHLRDESPECRSRTLRLAWPGERFSRVRDELCGMPPGHAGAIGYAMFVGGTNDDFGWSVDLGNPLQRLAIRLWLARQFLLFRSWTATDLGPTMKDRMEVFAQQSIPDRAQDAAIAEGAACAARAGFRLHFFHDFHVYDLERGGRTVSRQELAAR